MDIAQLAARQAALMDVSRVPTDILEALARYVEHGVPTGDCLAAILRGDLFDAYGRADVSTMEAMPAIVAFIYNVVPRELVGSAEAVAAHLERGRRARAARTSGVGQ